MGLKEVQIKLDNSNNTYYAGQTVNGNVVFEFDSPKKVRGEYFMQILKSENFHAKFCLCVAESENRVGFSLILILTGSGGIFPMTQFNCPVESSDLLAN
jgi:hypothetical protein